MLTDLESISMVILYAIVGALARALVGIYKSWKKSPDSFRLDARKVAVEFCTSVLVGSFGTIVIDALGLLKFDFRPMAMVGGLLGADILNLLTKKIGLTKGLDIVDMNTNTQLSEFNDREIAAMNYLKNNERINTSTYKKLNQTTTDIAKKELAKLASKRKIRRFGRGKATYYML